MILTGTFRAVAVERLRFRRSLLRELRRHIPTRRPLLPEVNSCTWCDRPKADHNSTSAFRACGDQYVAPSDNLRRIRLLAIRAERRRTA